MKIYNKSLLDFLPVRLAAIALHNWKIFNDRKAAKMFRLCEEKKKTAHLN